MLVDVPDQAFTDDFSKFEGHLPLHCTQLSLPNTWNSVLNGCAVAALERFVSLQDIQHLVITQLTPKNVPSIKALLKARNTSDGSSQLQITLSNPAKQILKSTMGMDAMLP